MSHCRQQLESVPPVPSTGPQVGWQSSCSAGAPRLVILYCCRGTAELAGAVKALRGCRAGAETLLLEGC